MESRYKNLSIPPLPENPFQWHTLKCRLITPLYGGGVESATVDTQMPIRISGIRGQLRSWWRLLAKNLWGLGSSKEIQQLEFKLWGGISKDAPTASEVFLRIRNHTEVKLQKYTAYTGHNDKKNSEYRALNYLFFPASNETDSDVTHDLLQEGFEWDLEIRFSPWLESEENSEFKHQIIETLRWWSQFGGIGSRTRRGAGAFIVEEAATLPDLLEPITIEEAENVGCKLVLGRPQQDAVKVWAKSVGRLQEFRQGAHVGRNQGQRPKPAGRSRWPEPDAIRRIIGTHAPEHKPEHPAGNLFPRGFFGMPIIFHFVGRKEPRDTQLVPKGKERMASPLILRPFYLREKQSYAPAALLLPYSHLFSMEVELKGGTGENVNLWNPQKKGDIRPILESDGDDPLLAFLNFFQKG